ncbi:MAG: dihydropteroate synthase [Chloroflexota bacterium]|nr:dihydropteroate synthase [Chloroflexota bacterium]
METVLRGTKSVVYVAPDRPTVLIGERINPTGRKKLAAELVAGNVEIVKEEALAQVAAGADVIDVNVGAAGVDQVAWLPCAVEMVQEVAKVPLSIDTPDPEALAAALKVYQGKPLVNSVNGEEKNLVRVLPLVAEHGAAVIGLCMDEGGIPDNPHGRLEIARKIIERAEALGISREDILIDCLALTVGADSKAALVTLEAIRLVRAELGVNMTLGASNVSFGLPDREVLNWAFLAMAIREGLNAPIVNAARVKQAVLAADVLLGRDEFAMRYIKDYRKRRKEMKRKT